MLIKPNFTKKNYNKKNISKSQPTTAAGTSFDDNDSSMPNSAINAADENEKEFDKTDKVIKKRKEHLYDFYHNAKRTKG